MPKIRYSRSFAAYSAYKKLASQEALEKHETSFYLMQNYGHALKLLLLTGHIHQIFIFYLYDGQKI